MWFYAAIFVLPPVLIAILIWLFRLMGKVQVRRWAWPVLLASIPLSFPWITIWAISGAIAPMMPQWNESPCLAPWLSRVICYCLWLQLFMWVLGLVIVIRCKGMVFTSPVAEVGFLVPVGAVMAFPSLYNAAFLALLLFLTPILSREVAEAASPDGRLLGIVYGQASWDGGADYAVVCETNSWCPLIAMNLDEVYEFEERSKQRLVWSKDSQVLELCSDNIPSRAYVLLPKFRFKSAGGPSVAQRTEIDRLMAEHGGPAP